jgi:TonB-linked SusC/RagA family outer membrane protein
MKKIIFLLLLIWLNCQWAVIASDRTISGSVTDNKNIPLSGVAITSNGNTPAEFTDEGGHFSVNLPSMTESLTFRRTGFKEKTVNILQDSVLKVSLSLEPVVELGYYEKPESQIIGAVSTISGKKTTDNPLVSVMGSLYGQLPGLGIIQNSGEVDKANYTLYIRGVATTTNAGSNIGPARKVLTLVDGLPMDISFLDPNQIETISILKDAAATSIYGRRGANGVVLVTTKRGIKQKTRVSFTAKTSMQYPTVIHKPLDAVQYATLYNEAYKNDGNTVDFYSPAAIINYQHQDTANIYRYPNIDWYERSVKDYSILSNYNLTLNGGIENAKYFVSIGYVTDNGIFKTDKQVNTYNTNNTYDRYNFLLNLDLKITKTTNVLLSFNGFFDNRINPGNLPAGYADATNIFATLLNTTPNAFPVLQSDNKMLGGDNVHSNPYALLNRAAYSNNTTRFFQTSLRFVQDLSFILRDLKLVGTYAFDSYAKTYINRSKTFA